MDKDFQPQSTENYELPKKPLTWVLSILHLICIIGFMWVGVFFIPQKYRWIWVVIMVAVFVHWKFAEG
jgi:membrane protein YdbS with pleckstrin-like domain